MAADVKTAVPTIDDSQQPLPPIQVWALPVIAAWLIPGGGHFLLGKRGRGILILLSVALMFFFGLAMGGAMFKPEQGDLLTTLINYGGFIGDLSTGAFYIVAVMLGYDQPDLAGHVHDYGTKFLVTAGLLNILAMVDAFDIAAKRKS
jgi:hypothetical protein